MSLSSFNQNLIKFLNELNITFPDYPIDLEYYNEKISQQEDVFLLQLFEELNPWVEDISELNQTIFQDEDDHFVLLDKIDITLYWERNISKNTKMSIFNYLHILYVTAHHHCKNTRENFEKVIDNLTSSIEESENDELELLDTEIYLKLLKNIKKFKKINNTNDCDDEDDVTEINDDDLFNHLEDTLGISSDGVIGGIAKDIIGEIQNSNLKEEDFSNPMNMISMLMGGGEGNSGIMNIVKNVGEKLHSRLENGNIDQDKLFGETNEMMSKLGSGDSPFSSIFNNMMGGGGANNFRMPKKMPNLNNNKQLQLMKRRERLKQKLEKKKKELAIAQNEIENSNLTENALVSETPKKKKRRRRKKKKTTAVINEV